jgi:hypothetical protein
MDRVVVLHKTGLYDQVALGKEVGLAGNTICEMLKERGEVALGVQRSEANRVRVIKAIMKADKPIMQLSKELDLDEMTIRAIIRDGGIDNLWQRERREGLEVRNIELVEMYNATGFNANELADGIGLGRRRTAVVIRKKWVHWIWDAAASTGTGISHTLTG